MAAVGVLLIGLIVAVALRTPQTSTLSYTDFVDKLDAGAVKTVAVDETGEVTGTLTDDSRFETRLPTVFDLSGLDAELRSQNVQVTATHSTGNGWSAIVLGLVPFAVIAGFLLWAGRRARRAFGNGPRGISAFGRSQARVIETNRPTTRFADVAGYEGVKKEIGEIADFLRRPDKYTAAGAKGPRGVLMIGPPGTGKTLLARALAGEARVRFLTVTGSEFVEMFVGVGASRVRDLFEQARKSPPAIIFIDEIDAIGGKRGAGTYAGNDEREQTLNQLLAEMDGFDPSVGIVVLAATNRPESLDPALLRPGRFDRTVVIPLPTQSERAAILAVHLRDKHVAADVDRDRTARATPGFSGADLANLVNEAAIHAVRDDRTVITDDDLSAARDRILLGRRDSANALLPEERTAVAVHESGHALIAALCSHADPIAKVTILPAGPTLVSAFVEVFLDPNHVPLDRGPRRCRRQTSHQIGPVRKSRPRGQDRTRTARRDGAHGRLHW